MWLISAGSLIIVMGLCVVGVFAPKMYYDDNLAQRIGMAGMFVFSYPRLMQLFEHQAIRNSCMPVEAQVAGHVGVALFAIGTAYKAWKHRPSRRCPPGSPTRRATDPLPRGRLAQ